MHQRVWLRWQWGVVRESWRQAFLQVFVPVVLAQRLDLALFARGEQVEAVWNARNVVRVDLLDTQLVFWLAWCAQDLLALFRQGKLGGPDLPTELVGLALGAKRSCEDCVGPRQSGRAHIRTRAKQSGSLWWPKQMPIKRMRL